MSTRPPPRRRSRHVRDDALGARPRAILATLPVLASLVVLTVAALRGAFAPAERTLQGWLGAAWPDAPLSTRVVLVEVDADALDVLGPPPWSPSTWGRISEALDAAGVPQVLLVDPAPRLVRDGTPSVSSRESRGARLRVVGHADPPAPLLPAGLALPLPTDHGVVVGLGDAARTPGWCALARCPSGPATHTPLDPTERAQLPRLSLGEILHGRVRTVVGPDHTVILGLTEPAWAPTVPVGPQGVALPRAEAVALGLATLQARAPRPHASPLVLLPLLALVVLVGALVAHLEPLMPGEAWIAALPLLVALLVIGLAAVGLVQLPLSPLLAAAVLGPLAETLRLRARTARFLARLARRLARTELGVARPPEPSPEGVLQQLAALTWNHLPTDRMLYVHREGERARVIGGFGLSASELDLPSTAAGMQALTRHGRADQLAPDDDTALAVLTVPREQGTLGWWVVAWDPQVDAPSPTRLQDLARWVGREIPARPVTDAFSRLLHTDRQLDAIEAAFRRSTVARERQRTLLRTASVPLAFTDRSGTIVFQNQAFEKLFRGGEGAPRSLRELVFRAAGPHGLSRRMRRLFGEGEAIRVAWEDRAVDVCAAPSADGARAGALIWLEQVAGVRSEASNAAK